MGKFEFPETTIKSFHNALAEKKIRCRELVEFYLERIDKFDKKGPRLNSLITINPKAREEADKLDTEFSKSGRLIGPLHGVPVLLKDNINTFDMPTSAGCICFSGFVPRDDAFIVSKLRKAGAIILAKANLHEFAMWGETISSALGQSLNPYDLTRTPGGSSGGTGAAIAANFGLIGIGTDTVNSIRSPASANCLVGIRPTMGLVSRSGIVPYAASQDTAGPMCRTIEDAARTLDAIAGYNSTDDETAWSVGMMPASYASFLTADGMRDNGMKGNGLKSRRIGILESFFGKEEKHSEVNRIIADVIKVFAQNGAETVSLNEPIDSLWLSSEVSVHLDEFREQLNYYLAALPAEAPAHSLEEIMATGKYHPGIKANLEKALSLSTSKPAYHEKLRIRAELRKRFIKLMAGHRLDTIAFPHQQQLVCKIGESQQGRNGVLASVIGFPSITVPAGFSAPDPNAPLGIPVGLELIGRPWSEPLLIEIAYGFEQATRVRKAPVLE